MLFRTSLLVYLFHVIALFLLVPFSARALVSAEKTFEPVELEFGKSYTIDELQILYAAQDGASKEHVDNQAQVNALSEGVTDPKAELRNKPVDFIASTAFQYLTTCSDHAFQTSIVRRFKVLATFDGNRAHFLKWLCLNIDGFGYISISGGYGKPFHAAAEYHHKSCQLANARTLCSYYHFGVATAIMTVLGKNPGMTMSTIGPGKGEPAQRPWVVRACTKGYPGGPALTCPEPDLKGPRCKIDQYVTLDQY